MKPFKQCPVCQSELDKIYNPLWMEKCGKGNDCPAIFSQYHMTSFDDDQLRYLVFHTKTFYVYAYFESSYDIRANTMYVYYRVFPRGQSVQSPLIVTRLLPIDFTNLDILEQKFKTLSLFV